MPGPVEVAQLGHATGDTPEVAEQSPNRIGALGAVAHGARSQLQTGGGLLDQPRHVPVLGDRDAHLFEDGLATRLDELFGGANRQLWIRLDARFHAPDLLADVSAIAGTHSLLDLA